MMSKAKPPLTTEQQAEKARLRGLYDRLKGGWQERNGRYLSQRLLAEIVGEMVSGEPWTQGAISQYLSEKSATKLNAAVVQAMAQVLTFDPAEVGKRFAPRDYVKSAVLSAGPNPKTVHREVASRPQRDEIFESSPGFDLRQAPYFVEIDWANGALSAGPGSAAAVDQEERRSLAFSETWLKKKGFKRKHLVIIEVVGESMEPRLSNGDVALINTHDKEIKDHRIYALRYGDDLRIKRLSRRYDGAVVISSDNPLPEFRDEIVPAADLPQLQILGRAVWVGGELH